MANGEIPTSADVDAILRQITYANSSVAPPASVTLDWTFDDGNGGAQGAGGALQALGSTTVTIAAVNQAPANTVPGAQATAQDTDLVFSDGTGNAITLNDADAENGDVEVTLSVSNGVLDANVGGRLGGETLANTETTGGQGTADVAVAADGSYIVTWVGSGAGDPSGVYAQRFASDGSAIGGQFLVNTTTADSQANARVAMNASGAFVVTWSSANQDGDLSGVYAQRFDATGAPQGSEFLVNVTTAGTQIAPDVAMDSSGGFAISWPRRRGRRLVRRVRAPLRRYWSCADG